MDGWMMYLSILCKSVINSHVSPSRDSWNASLGPTSHLLASIYYQSSYLHFYSYISYISLGRQFTTQTSHDLNLVLKDK